LADRSPGDAPCARDDREALVVAARSARHSDMPTPMDETAARLFPFQWRPWRAITSRGAAERRRRAVRVTLASCRAS
jgi:hypothetical protein